MHHPADLLGTLFPHDRQRVCRGVAGVDDQRQPCLASGPDVHPESRALPIRVPALAVIVETGFADGHDPRALRPLHQIGLGQGACGLVARMHADRSVEVVVGLCKAMHVFPFAEADAHA